MKRRKANSLENIMWSELGTQHIQGRKVYLWALELVPTSRTHHTQCITLKLSHASFAYLEQQCSLPWSTLWLTFLLQWLEKPSLLRTAHMLVTLKFHRFRILSSMNTYALLRNIIFRREHLTSLPIIDVHVNFPYNFIITP